MGALSSIGLVFTFDADLEIDFAEAVSDSVELKSSMLCEFNFLGKFISFILSHFAQYNTTRLGTPNKLTL